MWNKREVLTFWADITPLLVEERYENVYNKVPVFRQEKADGLHGIEHKAQSVGAWYLWMQIQKRMDLPEEPPFNLSHSGKYVLCSIAPLGEKIGCDVEKFGKNREKLAKRFFCESEYDRLMTFAGEKRTEEFYRYWVLKESFMKATRKGLSLPANSFELMFDGDVPKLKRKPEEIEEDFYYKEYTVRGAKIAVCSTCDIFAEEMQEVTL